MRNLTLYINKEWKVESQYDDTREALNNNTAIVVSCTEWLIDRIMHTKPFKDIQPLLTRIYEENKPEEVKYTLISCSKEISNIIKKLWTV